MSSLYFSSSLPLVIRIRGHLDGHSRLQLPAFIGSGRKLLIIVSLPLVADSRRIVFQPNVSPTLLPSAYFFSTKNMGDAFESHSPVGASDDDLQSMCVPTCHHGLYA